jgi:2-hydroxy-3-oxopropionate reductase
MDNTNAVARFMSEQLLQLQNDRARHQYVKLTNQLIVGVAIGAVAEALTLARAGGADPELVREALAGGFADRRILREQGRRMIERDFVPGGTMAIQLKDLQTIVKAAQGYHLTLPLAERTTGLYDDALAAGVAAPDHSAQLLQIERMSGGVQ